MKRRKFIAVFIILIGLFFIFLNLESFQVLENTNFSYYINNAFKDTGAQNIVASIYLNYRVYDTIFESFMVLIAIIAIIHFSRHEGGD